MKIYILPVALLIVAAALRALSGIVDGNLEFMFSVVSILVFLWATKLLVKAYISVKGSD